MVALSPGSIRKKSSFLNIRAQDTVQAAAEKSFCLVYREVICLSVQLNDFFNVLSEWKLSVGSIDRLDKNLDYL